MAHRNSTRPLVAALPLALLLSVAPAAAGLLAADATRAEPPPREQAGETAESNDAAGAAAAPAPEPPPVPGATPERADEAEPPPGAKPAEGQATEAKPKTTLYVLMLSGGTESESRPLVFLLRRVGNVADALHVRFRISGTADEGADYKPVLGDAVFPPGKSVVSVQVDTLDDRQPEGDETIQLTVLPPADPTAHDPPKDGGGKPGK